MTLVPSPSYPYPLAPPGPVAVESRFAPVVAVSPGLRPRQPVVLVVLIFRRVGRRVVVDDLADPPVVATLPVVVLIGVIDDPVAPVLPLDRHPDRLLPVGVVAHPQSPPVAVIHRLDPARSAIAQPARDVAPLVPLDQVGSHSHERSHRIVAVIDRHGEPGGSGEVRSRLVGRQVIVDPVDRREGVAALARRQMDKFEFILYLKSST